MKKIVLFIFTFISVSIVAQDNALSSKAAATRNENKNLPAGQAGVIEIKDKSHKPTAAMFATKKVETVAVDSTKKTSEAPKQPVTKPANSFTRKETSGNE